MPPEILEVMVSSDNLSEGEALTVTALVTDPDGLDDIVGVSLRAADNSATYIFLDQISQGTFRVAVTWDDIHAVTPIEFETDQILETAVQAVDSMGNTDQDFLSTTLTCRGDVACDGSCTTLGTSENCGSCGDTCTRPAYCSENQCIENTTCGNNIVDLGEQCDGTNLQGFTCESLGLGNGMLQCSDTCTFDTSSC